MTVIWAPEAVEDVEAALSYLSERNIVYYQRTESALVVLRVHHQRRQPIAR